MRRCGLPDRFPFPDEAALAAADGALAALPDGTALRSADGLAFGAMPAVAARTATASASWPWSITPCASRPASTPAGAADLAASERRALAAAAARSLGELRPPRPRSRADFDVPPERIDVAVPGTDPAPLATAARRPAVAPGGRLADARARAHRLLLEALASLRRPAVAARPRRQPRPRPAPRPRPCARRSPSSASPTASRSPASSTPAARRPYDAADLLVSASSYEGFGMALAEGLARGLPIVAAAGGAVADTVPPDAALLRAARRRGRARRGAAPPSWTDRRPAPASGPAPRRLASALPRWEDTAAAIEGRARGARRRRGPVSGASPPPGSRCASPTTPAPPTPASWSALRLGRVAGRAAVIDLGAGTGSTCAAWRRGCRPGSAGPWSRSTPR